MVKKDRKQYVIRLLEGQASVSVAELSEGLGLSEVSIRKLLDEMEREGALRRTWGGAVSALGAMGEPTYEEKAVRYLQEKRAIAQIAYDMIADGDAVYIDSGTTTLQLARLLVAGHKRKVLVCTNALNIAMEFRAAQDIQLVVIGGVFHPTILSCGGGMARDMLRRLFFDKGFVTGSHFSVEHGFTTPNLHEAEVKRAALEAAKETYLLADYSKYGNDSLAQIAPCSEMRTLITDWRAPQETIARFEANGVQVLRAKREEKG